MLQHVNLENSILSLNNQSQKTIYGVIVFIWDAQKRKIYRDKKQIGRLVVVYVVSSYFGDSDY